jgi:hypothetical protein
MADESELPASVDSSKHHGDGETKSFRFFNDPSSTINFPALDPIPWTITGNTIRYTGFEAANLTDDRLPDLGLFVPFVWTRIDNPDGSPEFIVLDWRNGKNGWYTPDFDGTGQSLLVTLDIITFPDRRDGHVAAGKVAADETLTQVFGPTSDGAGTNIPPPPDGPPEETLRPRDLLPFVDLGRFAPNETKPFDLVYTYEWGEGDLTGAYRTSPAVYTLAPVEHGHGGWHHDDVF